MKKQYLFKVKYAIFKYLKDNSYIDIHKNFFSKEESCNYLQLLINNTKWEQREYNFSGKIVKQPRLTAWFADSADMKYSYSGLEQVVQKWNESLINIKQAIESKTGFVYNSCLLNYYRNGNDSVALHADDEKELGDQPNIASLSLGATRNFLLRHNFSKEKISLLLEDGDLIIMRGDIQKFWKHAIPKSSESHPRLNLTFRTIKKMP